MSNQYLEKYRAALPTAQGNQILKFLIEKKDSGEISTINEFKKRLTELTSKILTERITPTLELYYAFIGEDISSSQYNEMLNRIYDDLEAGFAEANNLDEIITAHHNLINNVSLKALRYGINELESKITLYEFLQKNTHGFDDSLFNTFRETLSTYSARAEQNASVLFVDPRKKEIIYSGEDAKVDLVGERLILGSDINNQRIIRYAEWLSNSNSVRSELNVTFKNSNISNILDGKLNTFWIESILRTCVQTTGVPAEIALHMASIQDVNYIEIEPATPYAMTLTDIDYYDANNERQSLGLTARLLDGPTRINFGKITAKSVIIKLKQNNYKEIQFTKKIGESNFHRAILEESPKTVDINSISNDLYEILSSSFIINDIFNINTETGNQLKYFEYIFGLDNIRLGFSTFDERSIYVSSKKTVLNPGVIALRVDEVRPEQVDGSTYINLVSHTYPAKSVTNSAKFYHGSIEYYALIQLFTEDDYLIATNTIPLLPLGALRIYHERLVLTIKSTIANNADMGQLRFYADDDETNVYVYKNGTLLTYTSDWEFISSVDSSGLTVETAGSGQSMKRGIKVLSITNPLDIYTVSYTPTLSGSQNLPVSLTLIKPIDMVGDNSIRITSDNLLVIESIISSYQVARSEIYLVIIMRQNSAEENYSPAVEEFLLATGSRNLNKFLGD